MFEKIVETKFEDAHGSEAEHNKHSTEAAATLGAHPLLVSSATATVPITDDEGRETGAFLYRLTTRWKQRDPAGNRPG